MKFRSAIFKGGIIRTDTLEVEKLGQWDSVFPGNSVCGCVQKVAVELLGM